MSVTIVTATISAMPKRLGDPMPVVRATLTDGTTTEVFTYYPDELSFTAREFVGLTLDEARALKFKKDRAYLRGGA